MPTYQAMPDCIPDDAIIPDEAGYRALMLHDAECAGTDRTFEWHLAMADLYQRNAARMLDEAFKTPTVFTITPTAITMAANHTAIAQAKTPRRLRSTERAT